MQKYKIVKADSLLELEQYINELAALGYVLVDGVRGVLIHSYMRYFATMEL